VSHVTQHRRPVGWGRRGAAALVLLVATPLALLNAFGLGYFSEAGPERLREMLPGLLVASAWGVGAVAAALGLLGQRVLSPWLGVGLLPAALAAVNHAGVTGSG
jgi:hypothetical protein